MIVPGQALVGKGGAFVQEFKAFVSRGNVVDLAVGIIIGAAFTTIVDSQCSGFVSFVQLWRIGRARASAHAR